MRPFIPSWLDDAGLKPAEFRLYAHFCRRADESGIAWPGYDSMMKVCGVSRATICRLLSILESRGLLEKLPKPFGGSSRYRVSAAIVSPEERLDANSLTTSTNEAAPIVPLMSTNRSSNEASIVAPEAREGNPIKVIHRRKSNREISPEGIQFAQWFKSSLPESVNLKSNWQQSFAEIYDKLVRIDRRSPAQIREVSRWARLDDFWQSNFLSPSKLRDRNPGGIQYFDVFAEKMKQPTNKPSEQTKVKLGRRGEYPQEHLELP